MSQERIDAVVQRTRDGGAEVVALLKTGSAFYAPAASVGADGRCHPQRPPHDPALRGATSRASTAIDGLFVGVPTRLGSNGVEGIVEIGLTADEQAAFESSAAAVQEHVDKLVAMGALRGVVLALPRARAVRHGPPLDSIEYR